MSGKKDRIFCTIQAGPNICEICTNIAYYSLTQSSKFPIMELFRCGHGMCKICYDTMTKDKSDFSCPFCRDHGRVYNITTLTKGFSNTFSQFLQEFDKNPCLLQYVRHPFLVLHRQIIEEYQIKQVAKKQLIQKQQVHKQRQTKKLQKEQSRCKAICQYCHKDTFTSTQQLLIHIKAKHNQ